MGARATPDQIPAGDRVTDGPRLLDQPSWYAAVMGTGGTALVAAADPGRLSALSPFSMWLSRVLVATAAVLFCFLVVRTFVVRRLVRGLVASLRSPATGPAYATFPGAINVLALGLLRVTGWADTGAGQWVVLVMAAVGTTLGLALTVFFFVSAFESQDFEAEDISGTWFIPETVILLGAVLFGEMSGTLPEPLQRTAAVLSFGLLGVGLILFTLTATLFFNRLVLHRQVEGVGAPAMWIMLSPLSVSALAIQTVAAETAMLGGTWGPAALQTANFLGAILWGFSLWWVAAATLVTIHAGRSAVTFTSADWGFVFPPAAMVLATVTLGRYWQSGFMEAMGVIFSFVLLAVWGSVLTGSIIALARERGDRSAGPA